MRIVALALLLAACSRAPDTTECALIGTWEWRTRQYGSESLAGEYVFAPDGGLIERRLEPDHLGIAPLYERADGVIYGTEERAVDYSGEWRIVSEDAQRISLVMLTSWDTDRPVKRVYDREGPNVFRCRENEPGLE